MFDQAKGFKPFDKKIYLSSPTRHGMDEINYIIEAFDTNWLSTVGANIDEVERMVMEKLGCRYVVGLSTGTAAIHMCAKIAGAAAGSRVASSDMTFAASVNPFVYEGAEPVFIDTEYDTWNMDPAALEKAFELYPEIKVVTLAHLYGTPGKLDEIRAVCDKYGAVLVEDAAESLGTVYKGRQAGTFGTYNAISFNGNKVITGSAGGMFLTDDREAYEKVRKWSTQSREQAPWYEHEDLGYNYRMSNLIAGMIRGQFPHLDEHIAQKKVIYERYKKAFASAGLPVEMNPFDEKNSKPNHWLSCLLIKPEGLCRQKYSEYEAEYTPEHGKSCPMEILGAIAGINAEGRPIWKPMHMQPLYRKNPFVTRDGDGRLKENAKGDWTGMDGRPMDAGKDIFYRGLCLPSDNKMTADEQDRIIEVVAACFG